MHSPSRISKSYHLPRRMLPVCDRRKTRYAEHSANPCAACGPISSMPTAWPWGGSSDRWPRSWDCPASPICAISSRLSGQAVADLNANRRLLAVSRATRDFHIARGVEAGKTHVLYNGVDLMRFKPLEPTGWLHRELGLPADAMLIGSVGQLVLRKGQDVLARAALALAERFPRVHYVFVGERFSQKLEAAEFEQNLRRCFDLGPLAGRGHFLGVRGDVPEILPELTLLVHAARQEPLGRVLLEAAASGVAVIATDVGGTREIFTAEANAARLVPPDDPAALVAAMAELLEDERLRRRMGAAATRSSAAGFRFGNCDGVIGGTLSGGGRTNLRRAVSVSRPVADLGERAEGATGTGRVQFCNAAALFAGPRPVPWWPEFLADRFRASV